MKGIILAGGNGTRLYPITKVVSKQLLPVYDKPLIYYPLSLLLLAQIKDILVISTEKDICRYKELLGDGKKIGINIEYLIQREPRGLVEAFILGEKFIDSDSVCLCLGDNIFYGQDLTEVLKEAKSKIDKEEGAVIFGYPVKNPQNFGVVEFDKNGKVLSLEEKPDNPKSEYAIPGLYFYDKTVVEKAKKVTPSARGELEITTLNNIYLKEKQLNVQLLGRGMTWFDTGTPSGLLKATQFVESIQTGQGFYISCIEEIAWRRGFIDNSQLEIIGRELEMTDYGQYLLSLVRR